MQFLHCQKLTQIVKNRNLQFLNFMSKTIQCTYVLTKHVKTVYNNFVTTFALGVTFFVISPGYSVMHKFATFENTLQKFATIFQKFSQISKMFINFSQHQNPKTRGNWVGENLFNLINFNKLIKLNSLK